MSTSTLLISEKYGLVPGRGVCVFDPGTAVMAGSLGLSAYSAFTSLSSGRTAADLALQSGQTAADAALSGSALTARGQEISGDFAAKAGRMQKQAADYEAAQLEGQEGTQIGVAQRQGLDTRLKASMVASSARAGAAAGGVEASSGSAATTQQEITTRGEYAALMDMWQGKNAATGLENKARGIRYGGTLAEMGGEEQRLASRTSALATLASGSAAARGALLGGLAGATSARSRATADVINAGAGALRTYGALTYQTRSGSMNTG